MTGLDISEQADYDEFARKQHADDLSDIAYLGTWSGALNTDAGMTRSIEGTGTRIITLDVDASDISVVSASAQKQDDGAGTLTVQVIHDREVVNDASTSAAYGLAQVTAEIDSGWFVVVPLTSVFQRPEINPDYSLTLSTPQTSRFNNNTYFGLPAGVRLHSPPHYSRMQHPGYAPAVSPPLSLSARVAHP